MNAYSKDNKGPWKQRRKVTFNTPNQEDLAIAQFMVACDYFEYHKLPKERVLRVVERMDRLIKHLTIEHNYANK